MHRGCEAAAQRAVAQLRGPQRGVGDRRLLQRRVLSRRVTVAAGTCVLAVGTALFGLVGGLPTRASFIAVCLALRLTEGTMPPPPLSPFPTPPAGAGPQTDCRHSSWRPEYSAQKTHTRGDVCDIVRS